MNTISLCGSMDFFDDMVTIAEFLRIKGLTVYLPEVEEKKIDYAKVSDAQLAETKSAFIRQHLEKIRKSDAILIANYAKRGISGYVGANTLIEAAFAYALGKPIFILNEIGEQPCRPELIGLKPSILEGHLGRISW